MFFLQNPPKIAQNRRFCLWSRRIRKGQTLLISKMSDFLKIDAYMAILWPKENWTVFFLYFFGITQVKVENQLIFVKLLKNPQFLTKIHKVGLVWSATLISTDRISKNNKFQYFIVVRVEKYVSWARRRQPLWSIWVITFFGHNCHFVQNLSLIFDAILLQNLKPNMNQNQRL